MITPKPDYVYHVRTEITPHRLGTLANLASMDLLNPTPLPPLPVPKGTVTKVTLVHPDRLALAEELDFLLCNATPLSPNELVLRGDLRRALSRYHGTNPP